MRYAVGLRHLSIYNFCAIAICKAVYSRLDISKIDQCGIYFAVRITGMCIPLSRLKILNHEGFLQIRTLLSNPNSSRSHPSTSSQPPSRRVLVKGGRSSSFLKFSLRLGHFFAALL